MHLKKKPFDPHIIWFNRIEEMKMMWEFGVLEILWITLGKKEDEGTHMHMMVIENLDTHYTLGVDTMVDTL